MTARGKASKCPCTCEACAFKGGVKNSKCNREVNLELFAYHSLIVGVNTMLVLQRLLELKRRGQECLGIWTKTYNWALILGRQGVSNGRTKQNCSYSLIAVSEGQNVQLWLNSFESVAGWFPIDHPGIENKKASAKLQNIWHHYNVICIVILKALPICGDHGRKYSNRHIWATTCRLEKKKHVTLCICHHQIFKYYYHKY